MALKKSEITQVKRYIWNTCLGWDNDGTPNVKGQHDMANKIIRSLKTRDDIMIIPDIKYLTNVKNYSGYTDEELEEYSTGYNGMMSDTLNFLKNVKNGDHEHQDKDPEMSI